MIAPSVSPGACSASSAATQASHAPGQRSYALAFGFTSPVLELSRWPSATRCLVAVLDTTALSVVGGLLASVRAP